MKKCINCNDPVIGRNDKKYYSSFCKSSYHYKVSKEKEDSLFVNIDKQLKLNRRLLKAYNKAGKANVRKEKLIDEGCNPKYFTHYWKNQKEDAYLFCYEYGFLKKIENVKRKFVLVKW